MEKENKPKYDKKAAIILLSFVMLIALSIGGFFIYRAVDINNGKVQPYLLSICKNRVNNAQYLPDVNKLANNQVSRQVASSNNNNVKTKIDNLEKNITLENFNDVIELIGDIDNPYDRNFTINNVKDEVYKVLNHATHFNRWMYITTSEDLRGYGIYYVDYNAKEEHLTIMRKSGFQPGIYVKEQNNILTNDDFNFKNKDNYPFSEDIIYKIDYYFDDQDREVVECEILDVINYYEEDFVSKYQYIKNVKDTSFTKYVIDINSEVRIGDFIGYDIETKNELGSVRDFIQMDYSNKDDVTLLFVKQGFATAYNQLKNVTQVKFYKKLDDQYYLYNSNYSYGDIYNSNTYGTARDDLFLSDEISSYSYVNSIFDYYVNKNLNILLGVNRQDNTFVDLAIGKPDYYDENYKTRSSSNIEVLKREIYCSNGTDSILIEPCNVYNKTANDNNECYYNMQNLPLYVNQSLTALANNTGLLTDSLKLEESPKCLDVSKVDYSYETFIDKCLNTITKNIINTSYIEQNYNKIKNPKTIDVAGNVSAISDYIELNDFEANIYINNTTLTFNAEAQVDKTILLKNGGKYSLALVAKGGGNNFVMLHSGEEVTYKRDVLSLNVTASYNLTDFKTTISDDYLIGIGLVVKDNDNYLLCSQVKPFTFENRADISLPQANLNGYKLTYIPKFNAKNNLVISLNCKDVEAPKIEGESEIVVNNETKVLEVIDKFNFTDNNKIKFIFIKSESGYYFNYTDVIKLGNHTLIVYDYDNNKTEFNFITKN